MVAMVSSEIKDSIAAAVAAAKKRTSADIAVMVAPASDGYQPYALLYGFALGSVAAVALWWTKTVTPFPLLLLVQACTMALIAFVPALRHLCLSLIPKHVLHHHAARRAREEFLFVSRHAPPERPVVLLYVSLAERYAHVLHSRALGPKVPGEAWEGFIKLFTDSAKKPGIAAACQVTVAAMAETLAPHFPARP
jgi:putative membrane protein